MSATLCEECFPGHGEVAVYTIVPMSPCVKCGARDDRPDGIRTYFLCDWPVSVMPNWVHDPYDQAPS